MSAEEITLQSAITTEISLSTAIVPIVNLSSELGTNTVELASHITSQINLTSIVELEDV